MLHCARMNVHASKIALRCKRTLRRIDPLSTCRRGKPRQGAITEVARPNPDGHADHGRVVFVYRERSSGSIRVACAPSERIFIVLFCTNQNWLLLNATIFRHKCSTGATKETRWRCQMRRVLLMLLTSAAIGVVGTAGVSAAPIDGGAVGKASDSVSNVTQVQHWRWGSGGHWRWGSGGHWRWGSGGHWRWGSRGWRRW
jgi:hypothetical protein